MLQNHSRHLLFGLYYKWCIRHTTKQETDPLEDLVFTVKKKKLKWYRHIIITNNLSTAILQDTTLGKNRSRRLKKKKKMLDSVT